MCEDTPTAPETDELEKLLAEATPGPLRVEQDTTLIWGACNPDDTSNLGMGYPIAECRITAMSSWAKGPDADAGEANARGMAMWRDIAASLIALRAEVATLRASEARMRAERDRLQHLFDLEMVRPGRFPSCDCDDEDCVACAHYPELVYQAQKRIATRAALQGETK